MGRPREHDEDTRDQLLEAAGTLLLRHGAAGLTVRRLAEEVGTTTRAIYSLFGSKEGVVRAMFLAGFTGLRGALEEVGEREDPTEEVIALGLAYRASALARPHLYDVMFDCPVPEFSPSASDSAFALAQLERLRRPVTRAVAMGRMAGDPDEITMGLWGLVHGLASLELGGAPPDLDVDAVWHTAVRAMVEGLARA